MIRNLPIYSAIKLDNNYLVQLAYHKKYLINGNIVKGSINDGQVIVSDINNIQLYTEPTQSIIAYKNDEGIDLSLVEYSNILNKYNAYYDDEEEEYVFDNANIDVHIQFLKDTAYKDSFRPIYKEEPAICTPVEIEVIGSLEDTGSEFIESAIFLGNIKEFYDKGIYKVHVGKIAKDEFDKLYKDNSEVLSYGISSHNTIEYVQHKGNYIFLRNKPSYLKSDAVKITSSLKDAKDIEDDIRKEINTIINSYLYPQEVKVSDIRIIKDKLLEILSTLSNPNTTITTKNREQIKNAKTQINELIKLLG